MTNSIVGGHYKVGKKIGEGSFGIVYDGTSLYFISLATYQQSLSFVLFLY